jgi:hypothetical protein
MTEPDPIRVQTIRDRPKPPQRRMVGIKIMIAAFVLFAITLVLLLAEVPIPSDKIIILLYFCGPLPILPAAMLLVGFVIFLFRR